MKKLIIMFLFFLFVGYFGFCENPFLEGYFEEILPTNQAEDGMRIGRMYNPDGSTYLYFDTGKTQTIAIGTYSLNLTLLTTDFVKSKNYNIDRSISYKDLDGHKMEVIVFINENFLYALTVDDELQVFAKVQNIPDLLEDFISEQ